MNQAPRKIRFEPTELKSGTGWYVMVIYGDRPPLQFGGFKTEKEAQDWVALESPGWLRQNQDDGYA